MAPTWLALFVALALLCVSPSPVSSQNYDNHQAADYTCPSRFLPIAVNTPEDSPIKCQVDNCFSETDGCGPGNVCTLIAVLTNVGGQYQVQCQCNPPYVQGIFTQKTFNSHQSCFIPGQDICNPNPCLNGGTCTPLNGTRPDASYGTIDFDCVCPRDYLGKTCDLFVPVSQFPTPVRKAAPALSPTGSQGVCGTGSAAAFPTRCSFINDPQGRYVCCDGQGCNGFNSDNLTPHCKNYGYVPPNFGVGASAPTPAPTGLPSGSQGVCGSGAAAGFPVRCFYNNDPQGRYVCCDSDGCNGFSPPENFFPHCKSNGYVPTTL